MIGIDGGGSSCRFALLDGGARIEVSLGAANAFSDRPGTIATLRDGIAALAARAGLTPDDIAGARLHAGLAGIMTPADAAEVAAALPVRTARVTDDRPTTLRGALGGAEGTLAAIGTGSFFGRQAAGRTGFIGGWGFRLGDEASGAWIGRALLAATLHAVDGVRPRTGLVDATLADFGNNPAALVTAAQGFAPRDFAAFAARVVEAGLQGDPLAEELMREGADWILKAAAALGWRRGEALCLTGGLGPHYARVLDADVVAPRGTAVDGALALAADLPRGGDAP
ncbi:BadF/BadG/BcrA/BcrD ATPase family protein [Palleronia sp. KMU-117]|uniref:BadF/BadG/BcrA/BcrD ATPase family protein n=1 Tax=Palleronia sp. KMU-117 TaxID=3434108 RepID=UPI003D758887